jgi:HI0933-like protein
MESRVVPKLYFAGEILDVDGITGGYNFQGAWSLSYIAGHAIGAHATTAAAATAAGTTTDQTQQSSLHANSGITDSAEDPITHVTPTIASSKRECMSIIEM